MQPKDLIEAAKAEMEEAETESEGGKVRFPILGRAALSGPLGEIVNEIMPHTEADPAGVLIHLMVGLGNLIGRAAWFQVGGDRHYLNTNAVCVGGTASGAKGTAWGASRPILKRADPVWAATRTVEGLSSGEGLIWAVRDPIYKTEYDKKAKATETVLVDAGEPDKRLFVVETELGGALKRAGREGNTLSAVMRQAWDGGDVLRVLTKTTPVSATAAHISMIGHITAEELRMEINRGTDVYNGFANRCLWLCVRRSKLLPHGGRLSDAAMDRLGGVLAGVKSMATPEVLGRLTRDREAEELWESSYAWMARGRGGAWGKVTARAVPQTVRLSGLYAVASGRAIVTRKDLEAAMTLWRYCEESAAYVFGSGVAVPDEEADRELVLLVAHAGGSMGVRNVMRSGMKRRYPTADLVRAAFGRLERAGMGKVEYETREPGRSGRDPSPVFRLRSDGTGTGDRNPAGHIAEADSVICPPSHAENDVVSGVVIDGRERGAI